LLGDLDLAVEEYRRDSKASEKFVSTALQYRDHLIAHMQKEEAILFILVEEMLDDRVKDALTHVFSEASAEARGWVQRYEQLAKELEKTWTV